MIALIQRVKQASVCVDNQTIGQINKGILVLLGIEKNDSEIHADRLLKKILGYRIFPDEMGKMNLNIEQAVGELLVISQFTLVADTKSGMRPSFSSAGSPDKARHLYDYFIQKSSLYINTAMGEFAADMDVHLTNDGPVTFLLDV